MYLHLSCGYPASFQVILHLGDRQLPKVEKGSRQRRVHFRLLKDLRKVRKRPTAAGGDDRNAHSSGDGAEHVYIKARLRTVGVHGGEEYLPRSQALTLGYPLQKIDPGAYPAAAHKDLPAS